MRIDLNADLGESFGAWRMGDDGAMLDIVTSANVACGFHAGDPATIDRTVRVAVEHAICIVHDGGGPEKTSVGGQRRRAAVYPRR